MSLASRHGKLCVSAEDDGTRFRRLEDLLTADVFGAFRYLPPHLGVRPLLEHALSPDGVSLRAWAEERGIRWLALSRATFAFWPSLADGREPDLVLALGDEGDPGQLVALVEVKLHADQHEIGGVSQIGFYGSAMLDDRFDDAPFEFDLPALRPVVLLTAASEPPMAALLRARRELGVDHVPARSDVFWVSWTTVAILAAGALEQQSREARPPHEVAVLEDLVEDLGERGFAPPRPRTSLPMPRLPALAPWRGWGRQRRSAFWQPVRPGLHLERIDSALRSWRLR